MSPYERRPRANPDTCPSLEIDSNSGPGEFPFTRNVISAFSWQFRSTIRQGASGWTRADGHDLVAGSMTIYWIYDIPVWAFWLLTVGTTCAVGVGGMVATRGWVGRFHRQHSHNEVVSYFLTEVGVLYGIMLGLIAVGTWQNYTDTESKVTMEAASLTALYRDVSNYPNRRVPASRTGCGNIRVT